MVARKVGRRTGKGKGKAVEKTAPPLTKPAKLWEDAPATEEVKEDNGPWYSDLQPFSVLEEDGGIKRPAGVSWSWTAPKSLPGERIKNPKDMAPPAVVGHDSIWRNAKDFTKLAQQKKVNGNYGGGHGGGLLKKAKTDGAAGGAAVAAKHSKRLGSTASKQKPATSVGAVGAAVAATAKAKAKKAREEDEEANTDDEDDDDDNVNNDGNDGNDNDGADNSNGAGDDCAVVNGGEDAKTPTAQPAQPALPADETRQTKKGAKSGGSGGGKSRRQARQAKLAALAAAAQQTAHQVLSI